jgi:hypothetical protein
MGLDYFSFISFIFIFFKEKVTPEHSFFETRPGGSTQDLINLGLEPGRVEKK